MTPSVKALFSNAGPKQIQINAVLALI